MTYRGVNTFSAVLVTWHTVVFALFSYASASLGSRMTLRGDSFGVELNVAPRRSECQGKTQRRSVSKLQFSSMVIALTA